MAIDKTTPNIWNLIKSTSVKFRWNPSTHSNIRRIRFSNDVGMAESLIALQLIKSCSSILESPFRLFRNIGIIWFNEGLWVNWCYSMITARLCKWNARPARRHQPWAELILNQCSKCGIGVVKGTLPTAQVTNLVAIARKHPQLSSDFVGVLTHHSVMSSSVSVLSIVISMSFLAANNDRYGSDGGNGDDGRGTAGAAGRSGEAKHCRTTTCKE